MLNLHSKVKYKIEFCWYKKIITTFKLLQELFEEIFFKNVITYKKTDKSLIINAKCIQIEFPKMYD